MIPFNKKDNAILVMNNPKRSTNKFISGLEKAIQIFVNIFVQIFQFRTSKEEKILSRHENERTK